MNNRPRRPWLAALLTLIFSTGLGHMYSGRLKRGIILFAIALLLPLSSAILLTVTAPKNLYLLFIVFIHIAFLVFCIIDATISARRGKKEYQPKKYNRWYAYIGFVIIAGVFSELCLSGIMGLVPNFSFQAFKLPTANMEPTLLIGDHILVKKRIYRTTEPTRGDIIAFEYPENPEFAYVKRVIGMPGDIIEVKGRTVYINNNPLDETYTQHINPGSIHDHYGPIYIPMKGDKIEVTESTVKVNDEDLNAEVIRTYTELDVSYNEPCYVQQDYYFAMGDNRDNSMDSRFWGAVPHDHLLGKAFIIYWSIETPRDAYLRTGTLDRVKQFLDRLLNLVGRTRWDRIFMPVE